MSSTQQSPNNNNNNFYPFLTQQQDQFITLIENANFERDKIQNDYRQLKLQYDTLKQQHSTLSSRMTAIKTEIDQSRSIKTLYEKKMNMNMDKMIKIEKEKAASIANASRLEHENNLLNQQLQNFKVIYEELEKRKNNEIDNLTESITKLRQDNEMLKNLKNENQIQIQDLLFETTSLKQELDMVKVDRDKLTKIIEDAEMAVKTIEEKEKTFETTVRSYQQQIKDIKLEKEKINVKLNLQLDLLAKNQKDYNSSMNLKNEQFNKAITDLKEKYENIIQDKLEDINISKSECISMKIERDKYFTEHKILQNEIDKMIETFKEENQKNMELLKETEEKNNRIQIRFQEKIKMLTEHNEQLEKENQLLNEKINNLEEEESKRKDLYGRLSRNESETHVEIAKIQKKAEDLEDENFELKKKLNRLEIRYKELEEISLIRINSLQNTLKDRNQLGLDVKLKAYDLLNEQQGIGNNSMSDKLNPSEKHSKVENNKNKGEQKEDFEYDYDEF